MKEKIDLAKSFLKKLIINPYVIIIAFFAFIMYFFILPTSKPKKEERTTKVEYNINSFDRMVKGDKEKDLDDSEEEKLLLGEESAPKKKVAEYKPQEKKPTITEEYADKINKILQASRQKPTPKAVNRPPVGNSKGNVYSEEVLKNVYNMLNTHEKGVIDYINDNLRTKNIIGDRSQLIKIRGDIPVVCETARLLCEEKVTERVPYARCITLYKNCSNPKDYQEISLDEYRSYKSK